MDVVVEAVSASNPLFTEGCFSINTYIKTHSFLPGDNCRYLLTSPETLEEARLRDPSHPLPPPREGEFMKVFNDKGTERYLSREAIGQCHLCLNPLLSESLHVNLRKTIYQRKQIPSGLTVVQDGSIDRMHRSLKF